MKKVRLSQPESTPVGFLSLDSLAPPDLLPFTNTNANVIPKAQKTKKGRPSLP